MGFKVQAGDMMQNRGIRDEQDQDSGSASLHGTVWHDYSHFV